MAEPLPDEVKITVIIGQRTINVLIHGTGNSSHIRGYFEVQREYLVIQPQSEVVYIIIPTGQVANK